MYDIFFISYHEPNADFNWNLLKSRFPNAKRVNGVKGIHQAHINAAKKSFTKMFWVVDADAILEKDFEFTYKVDEYNLDTVHVWRSRNPINGLVYGYGGIKLLPKKLTINLDMSKPDMTTSISSKFKIIQQISNITAFNTDPFNTWKSAFRECVKLSSGIIDRHSDLETQKRLDTWCSVGEDQPFGKYAILGANQGKSFGQQYKTNVKKLRLINDFEWLYEQFSKNTV